MRSRLLVTALAALPMFVACAGGDEGGGPTPYDDDFPLSDVDVNDGAPDNSTLPDDNKADAVYPAKFELTQQSPVKSQGSRGTCSIFAATALVENVYIVAGMPLADADFSEQYMQWSSKVQGGSFPNSEGSTSNANLDAAARFGTVKESAWPYESSPWSEANDPACTGESRPTKCYTNGEPPDSAKNAMKFKVPTGSRWINVNSIKAHITTKKTGVNVGMDFYYQAWNHRRSALPVSTALWQMGVVTYPNQADKTESRKSPAGHAIHIIGWDDNIEFEMRDGEGKPILENGVPKKEKGFWIFKNSWGTAGFGINHPTGPGYGYLSYKYVSEEGSAAIAALPVVENPREVCDDAGDVDEDNDGKANCDDSECSAHPSCGGNNTAHTYNASPAAGIPDDSTTGVSNTIAVSDTGTITSVKLTVDISHSYRGDLKVTLTKGSTSKVVFNGTGGSADDLKQSFDVTGITGSLAGDWTLKVEDTAAQDVGTLNAWTLEVTAN
ncbi:MAG TPA: proprotein convertase P-domain-containing protein [Kofleriaceae bacterium]